MILTTIIGTTALPAAYFQHALGILFLIECFAELFLKKKKI